MMYGKLIWGSRAENILDFSGRKESYFRIFQESDKKFFIDRDEIFMRDSMNSKSLGTVDRS
jgi:hypothetical protein